MKKKNVAKGKKIIRQLVFVSILVAVANRLTKSEKGKAERLEKRKERHNEWASDKIFFSDEARDL